MDGYDMRRDMAVDWPGRGRYSTDLFTEEAERLVRSHPPDPDTPLFLYLAHLAPHAGNYEAPLQAPAQDIARFQHIKDPERRVYAGQCSAARVTATAAATTAAQVADVYGQHCKKMLC